MNVIGGEHESTASARESRTRTRLPEQSLYTLGHRDLLSDDASAQRERSATNHDVVGPGELCPVGRSGGHRDSGVTVGKRASDIADQHDEVLATRRG